MHSTKGRKGASRRVGQRRLKQGQLGRLKGLIAWKNEKSRKEKSHPTAESMKVMNQN